MTAAIVDRQMRPTYRRQNVPASGTRRECWWALLEHDGEQWEAERIEEPGTPWQLVRVADGRTAGWYGSLKRCQTAVASGAALRQIAIYEDEARRGGYAPTCFLPLSIARLFSVWAGHGRRLS